MAAKLFEARNKLSNLQSLKKHLQQYQPDQKDCHNLLDHCFNEHRQNLAKVAQILKPYTKSIFNIKLKQNQLILDLCRYGTVDQLISILKLDNINNFDRKEQCVDYVIKMQQRKDDKYVMMEMLKILYAADPKIITNCCSRNIAESLQNQYFDIAQFLIQKGVDVSYQSKDKQNLMHILMKKYNKKQQHKIMNLRNILISKGVDDKKYNNQSKKPYDLCPPEFRTKLTEQPRSQINTRRHKGEQQGRYKGKSEQGSEIGRAKGQQYRQKSQAPHLIKFDSIDQVQKMADNYLEKRTNQKYRQLVDKEKEKEKWRIGEKSREKQRERKQKINKKVFSPDQLKHFLNQEICYFVEQIQRENDIQKAFLNQLIDKITKQIHEKVGATVQIFGSFATGLSLLQSDIDMVITPQPDKQPQSSFSLLQKISTLLQSLTQQVQSVKYIKTASVPIIKIQCTSRYKSKKIDITYKDENHNGLISVELIQQYLNIYPNLRSLVFVLKKFIYSTNIYDPYSGGLSSYGLILMIVAYLQDDNRDRKAKGVDGYKQPTIAELLIGFLYFYGFKSNYINKQICVIDPEKAKAEMAAKSLQRYTDHPIYIDAMQIQFMVYPNNDWQPRAKLVIIDPLNPKNNIGRATHKIREIKTAFEMAYICIHTNKNCKSKKTCKSYQRIMAIDLKDTKYDNYKRPCCIIHRMLNSSKSLTTC